MRYVEGGVVPGGSGFVRRRDRIIGRVASRIVRAAAARHRVTVAAVLGPARGSASVAEARHLAMYLIHTGLGESMTRTGRYFGRDRTTVAHACRRVEERRDDPGLDALLDRVEAMILRSLDRCEGMASMSNREMS